MGDKRQEGIAIKCRIDTRVHCPAEMHTQLHLLPDRKFWVATKFIDSHLHDLSSPNKVHHFYSHQKHRSKMSRTIMSNLIDVGMLSLIHI